MSTPNFRPNILHNDISKPILNLRGSVTLNETIDEEGNRVKMCHICGVQVTHRWTPIIFGGSYVPVSTRCSHSGSYTVYKGFCLRQTCYTIAAAQKSLGEGVDVTNPDRPTQCLWGIAPKNDNDASVAVSVSNNYSNDILQSPLSAKSNRNGVRSSYPAAATATANGDAANVRSSAANLHLFLHLPNGEESPPPADFPPSASSKSKNRSYNIKRNRAYDKKGMLEAPIMPHLMGDDTKPSPRQPPNKNGTKPAPKNKVAPLPSPPLIIPNDHLPVNIRYPYDDHKKMASTTATIPAVLPSQQQQQQQREQITSKIPLMAMMEQPIISTPLTLKDGDIVEFLVKLENRRSDSKLVFSALAELKAYIEEQNDSNPDRAYLPGDRWFKVFRLIMQDHIKKLGIVLVCLSILTRLCAFQPWQQKFMIKYGLVSVVLSIIEHHRGEQEVQHRSLFLLESLCSDEKNGINAETTSISRVIRCMIESMRQCQGKAQECAVRGLYKLSMQKRLANPLTKKILAWEIRQGLQKDWVSVVLDDVAKHSPALRTELHRLFLLQKSKVKPTTPSRLTPESKTSQPFCPSTLDSAPQKHPQRLSLAAAIPTQPDFKSNLGDSGGEEKEEGFYVSATPPQAAPLPSPPPPPPPPSTAASKTSFIPIKETPKQPGKKSVHQRPHITMPVPTKRHEWKDDEKEGERQNVITRQMEELVNETDLNVLRQFLYDIDAGASVVESATQVIITLIESKVNCSTLRPPLGQTLGNLLTLHVLDVSVMESLVGLIVCLCETDGFYCLKMRNRCCVGLLLQAMKEHPDSLPIQGGCCSILWLLSESEHGKRVIGNENGCETIILSLSRHNQSPRLQREGLTCLRNLARLPSNQKHIQDGGAENLVLNIIQIHIGTPDVIEIALLSLNDFVINVSDSGGVCPIHDETLQAVFFAMIDNHNNEGLQKSACILLRTIMYNPENQRLMQDNRDGLVNALHVAATFPSCEERANRIMQKMGY